MDLNTKAADSSKITDSYSSAIQLEYPESDDTEEHELEEAQEEHNGDNGEEQANK